MADGYTQLNRYLLCAWVRAGIPGHLRDDASQTVYALLLARLTRAEFDALVSEIGRRSVGAVLNRGSACGPEFFRAVDTAKKRFQRERTWLQLDNAIPAPTGACDRSRNESLREAIERSLDPREAALVRDTLQGRTPAEIAVRRGVEPKTVSNQKTAVIRKLREAMSA